jgi:hypothetical protein
MDSDGWQDVREGFAPFSLWAMRAANLNWIPSHHHTYRTPEKPVLVARNGCLQKKRMPLSTRALRAVLMATKSWNGRYQLAPQVGSSADPLVVGL